jgi:hypothetical protein
VTTTKIIGKPCAGRSSRQGCDPAGASPATSVVHVEREATPHPGPGNRPGYAWCERPGGPALRRCGRSSRGAKRVQEPEGDRMTEAPISAPRRSCCGGKSARPTVFPSVKAGVLGEGMDVSSRGARRGMGPSACTRVAEIMSGRAISQQGLAATCKDPAHKAKAKAQGGSWSGAWARMSWEGGVTPSEEIHEVSPTVGSARGGQRSPGYSAVAARGPREDMAMGSSRPNSSPVWTMSRPGSVDACWDEETGKPPAQGVYASQRFSLGTRGQARALKNACRAETRTGLGKADRPGSQRGFGKRGQSEQTPCGARVRFLSRQPHARIERGMRKRTRQERAPRL